MDNTHEDGDDEDDDGTGTADTSRLNVMFSKAPEGEGSTPYAKLEARINRKASSLLLLDISNSNIYECRGFLHQRVWTGK
jgi:hypothetical protein